MGFVGQAAGRIVGGITGGVMDGSGAKDTFVGQTPDIQKQDLVGRINELSPAEAKFREMLMQRAAGTGGPSPAELQMQQGTDRAIQQTAGALASARGISPALATRLIANNGANQAQQANQQAALLRANEQLGTESLLNSNLLNTENTLQSANASQNAAINQGSLGAQGLTAGAAAQNAQTAGQMAGGLMNSIGAGIGLLGGGGKSAAGTYAGVDPSAAVSMFAAHGGEIPGNSEEKVPVMLSPGEKIKVPGSEKLHTVPGKAKVEGDSPENDTVPAKLPEGSVVVPRSKADNEKKAKSFIEAVKEQKEKEKGPQGYSRVLEARRHLQEAMKHIEAIKK